MYIHKRKIMSSLPISSFKAEILNSIKNNSVVIITAETGAGKSTQVPKFLVNAGYRVVVTQPRRLAATSVAERVAEEMGCKLGTFIGYRTGEERCDSNGTRCLFVTDGLQLVRELTQTGETDVLVLDEVHEWNLNIEVLVAWFKHQQQLGSTLKVVLMSATMEAEKLSQYFNSAPIISVPGRTFPVKEKQDTSDSVVANVKVLVSEGRNVLIFQPGKAEIEECIFQIGQELGKDKAIILPLHGNLSNEEQHKVFQSYSMPKVVVATNVAQTSITIPDIDAVIDTGCERRIELVDGIEGLYLKEISKVDCLQRKGRAGRTKEGIYILCSETSLEDRNAFPKSEIERSRLDQMVLRLAVAGFDASQLDFFHDPGHEVIVEAKRTLQVLGSLDHDGKVTQIGRQMAKLPLSVQFSRMVVEAARYGVLDEVITVAAILEVGGITARDGRWSKLTKEHDSDLLAQLDVYQKACELHKSELHDSGVLVKNFFRVKELRRKLWKSVRVLKSPPIVDEASSRDMIKKACLAGMVDHVYQSRGRRLYSNGDSVMRQITRESVVSGEDMIVGLPLDIQILSGRILNLVQMVTKVNMEILKEIAPQLFEFDENYTQYDVRNDIVKTYGSVKFNEQVIQSNISQPCADKAKATEVLAEYLACQTTR